MAGKMRRAVIVGATSSLGKELAEVLSESVASAWDVRLIDANEAGQVTAAGDEALVVGSLEDASFVGVDVVFFVTDAGATRKVWKDAAAANAALVDLTGVLEGEAGALFFAPAMEAGKPDLSTVAMAPILPATWLLASVAARSQAKRVVATVLGPTSQLGDAAMDELHQQTVALLSFQNQPREMFDAQVAFTLRDAFGPEAKFSLAKQRERVERELRTVLGDEPELTFQLLQAPVFHGMTASLWLEYAEAVDAEVIANRLNGAGFEESTETGDAGLSNQDAVGQNEAIFHVRAGGTHGVWVWIALDNLRWMARAAESAALEMLALRPGSTVQ
jgi:aspartate-semialdehyde dehydrogenase